MSNRILYREPKDEIMLTLCAELAKWLHGPCSLQILVSHDGTAFVDTADGLELAMLTFAKHESLYIHIAATGSEFSPLLPRDDPQPVLKAAARIINATLLIHMARANAGEVWRIPRQHRWDKSTRALFRAQNSDD